MPRRRRRPPPLPLALAQVTTSFLLLYLFLVVLVPLSVRQPPNLAPGSVLFLIAGATAAIAAWSWHLRTHHAALASDKQLTELQAMTPAAFEHWVAARFRDLGYDVRATGTHGTGGDHGIDIVATKPNETAVVQAKKYITRAVGEPMLRDLYGAMTAASATRAYLVTTGHVTQQARDWAAGKPIEIWDAGTLTRLGPTARSGPAAAPTPDAGASPLVVAPSGTATPLPPCPRCGAALVERRNRKTDAHFYGCSRFPACRFTTPTLPQPS